MANKVLLKKSSVVNRTPTAGDLDYGELAINYADEKLYFKNASNTVKSFNVAQALLTIGSGLSGTSYNGTSAVTIAIDSTVVTLAGSQTLTNKTLTSPVISGGTINNTIIGGTTAAAGSFTTLSASGIVSGLELTSTQSSGDEGGQINLAKAVTNTTLSGGVTIDVYQNKLRIFEQGGTSRGVFIDLSSAAAGVASNLLSGGSVSVLAIDGDTGTDNVTLGSDTLSVLGGTGLTSTVTNNTITIDIDSTVATLTDAQTLTNKTIAAGSNTISGLTNTNLSGTAGITNANLANSSLTIGTTAISLGASSTTLAGLTSVTSTSFVGALTGNASTATTLSTGRTIALTGDVTYTSGAFNGSANVTGAATLAAVGTAGTYTKVTTDAKGRVTSGTTLVAADIPSLDASKITTGTIDASRLPSYVDDVVEGANLAAFPATGETGKIYVALDTNKTYRWSGSAYVYITSGAVDSVGGYTGVVTSANLLASMLTVDGAGSGLDADTLDGNHASAFYLASNPSGYTTNTGTVTAVTGTAPIVSSGGTTPAISITAATTAAAGSMSAADKTKLDGIATGATANTGTVTSVAITVPTGLTVTGSPITTSGTLAVTLTAGYSIPTTASQTNWDTAFTDRMKWDGGATGLVAATGRTSLGGTTVGQNFFTLANPSAIAFPRMNADNTVSALDAATFRTAIGAGTVTSVGGTSPVVSSGGTAPVISLASGYGDTQNPYGSKTMNMALASPQDANGVPTFRNLHLSDMPSAWIKRACACATTGALTLNTAQTTIDGVTLATATRVLIKDQATASQNGIYTNVNTTTWVRASDADVSGDIAGAFVSIDAGTVNGGKVFDNDFKSTDTIGTTAMNWYQNIDRGYLSTVGNSFATLTNPSAITFPRMNADNTVSALDAATFRTAIGAGTSSTTGTVTSVGGTGTVSGLTLTGTVTTTGNLTLGGTLTLTSGNVTTALGFTPYNATNPSAYIALGSAITGYTAGTNTALAATDTVLAALGKLQGQVSARGTGTVTSVGGTGGYGGLTLTGTVTTTGNLTLGGTPTGTWPISVSGSAASATTASTATAANTVNSPDGDRNASTKLPTTTGQRVRFDFASAASAGTGGNYAGVMTYAPWDGTTASTGDASYQLAFGSTASNGGGIPQLNIRKGIDSTWNAWYTMIHSGNIASYSSVPTIQTLSVDSNGNLVYDKYDNNSTAVINIKNIPLNFTGSGTLSFSSNDLILTL